MIFGIMGAMAEEVALLRGAMEGARVERRGGRDFVSGTLRGRQVVVVFSRWGKVAAASTATTLIERFGANFLLFTGVAGAVDPDLSLGDIVVGERLVQHDMDASPLPGIQRFEIPLLGVSAFQPEAPHLRAAQDAAQAYLAEDLPSDVAPELLAEFGISAPRVVTGTIASGDRFVADPAQARELALALPGLRCVEMEGAAVAQVAFEHGLPCLVLRTISDKADHSAVVDFPKFVARVASHFTCGSVLRLLPHL